MLTAEDADAQAGDFTGSIAWDDGSTSAATFDRYNGECFTVGATHTPFGTAGTHHGTLTVTVDDVTRTMDVTFQINEPVAPPPVVTPLAWVVANAIHATRGQEFSGVVGRIQLTDPSTPLEGLLVTIDWGDGASSTGTITVGENGWLTVSGTHTYFQETHLSYSRVGLTVRSGGPQQFRPWLG